MKIGEWTEEKPSGAGMYFAKQPGTEDSKAFFVRVNSTDDGDYYYAPEQAAFAHRLYTKPFMWAKVYLGSEAKEEVAEIFPGTLEALGKIRID